MRFYASSFFIEESEAFYFLGLPLEGKLARSKATRLMRCRPDRNIKITTAFPIRCAYGWVVAIKIDSVRKPLIRLLRRHLKVNCPKGKRGRPGPSPEGEGLIRRKLRFL